MHSHSFIPYNNPISDIILPVTHMRKGKHIELNLLMQIIQLVDCKANIQSQMRFKTSSDHQCASYYIICYT